MSETVNGCLCWCGEWDCEGPGDVNSKGRTGKEILLSSLLACLPLLSRSRLRWFTHTLEFLAIA
jgi:hypothetical protein